MNEYRMALDAFRANPSPEGLEAVWACWRALSAAEQADVAPQDACRE